VCQNVVWNSEYLHEVSERSLEYEGVKVIVCSEWIRDLYKYIAIEYEAYVCFWWPPNNVLGKSSHGFIHFLCDVVLDLDLGAGTRNVRSFAVKTYFSMSVGSQIIFEILKITS
jgi:hypothetical protein